MNLKFPKNIAKAINEAIFSVTNIDLLQTHRYSQHESINLVIKHLKKSFHWKMVKGNLTHREDGQTYQLEWCNDTGNIYLMHDASAVFKINMLSQCPNKIAETIHNAVFDDLISF